MRVPVWLVLAAVLNLASGRTTVPVTLLHASDELAMNVNYVHRNQPC